MPDFHAQWYDVVRFIMQKFVILAFFLAITPASSGMAAPVTCMSFNAMNPHAHHAPRWAWMIMQNGPSTAAGLRGAFMGIDDDDPIWQHATCDDVHHVIEWCFPTETRRGACEKVN